MDTPSEHVQVPLVIYVDGERKIIGEATLSGEEIKATINDNGLTKAVMNVLFENMGEFSLNPFAQERIEDVTS